MGTGLKPTFPPLLNPGLNDMNLKQIRKLCVESFPSSSSRPIIMNGLEAAVALIEGVKLPADLWVDGSFVTSCPDPADCDLVMRLDGVLLDSAPPAQIAVVERFANNLRATHHCDSYCFAVYPEGHPLHQHGLEMRAYWLGQFGFDRKDQPKGLARLKLCGGTP